MLWKGINNNVSLKPYNLDKIPHIKHSKGNLIKDPQRVANEFNQFFTNIASEIKKKIPRNQKSLISYLSNPNLSSLSFPLALLKKYNLLFNLQSMVNLVVPTVSQLSSLRL